MADDRVVGHLAELFWIERAGLAEEPAVYRDFADVVQISSAAQRGNFVGIHAHGLADGRGVAAHAQRVAVNVDVLYINGGSKASRALS